MNRPLLTVVIPIYFAEKTLKQCIDSVLSQCFKNFELLLIDDGSKDSSLAICNEYANKDSRIRVFHQVNNGVSSARNIGLDHARGKWITFVDADDYLTGGYFDGLFNQTADIIIKSYIKFNNEGIVSTLQVNKMDMDHDIKNLINNYLLDSLLRGPVFKFYKKSIIGDLRFLTDMKIGEDAWFVFKYLERCRNYAVVQDGEYVVRVAEQPDEVKYAISVDYAVQSLSYLQGAFDGLVKTHHVDKSLFLHYIGYYKRISKNDWGNDKSKWYANKEVKDLYRYIWPVLSYKQKLRIVAAKMLKK